MLPADPPRGRRGSCVALVWKPDDDRKGGLEIALCVPSLADARLIAAAPDYDTMAHHLEAWWRLPNEQRTIASIEPVIRECLDAIAKAEGAP